jgi:hypothetical protein
MVVDRAFAVAGLDRQVPFEVADYASAAGLVRHGLGSPSSRSRLPPDSGPVPYRGR